MFTLALATKLQQGLVVPIGEKEAARTQRASEEEDMGW